MTTPDELFAKSEFSNKREPHEFREAVRTADWLSGLIRNGRNITKTQCPFPDLLFTHFPGESASGKEGFFAQMMGTKPYIHDYLFWWEEATSGFIELKWGTNKPSKGQLQFDSKLEARGFKYRALCYSTEEVRDTLISWKRPYVPVPIPPRKATDDDKRRFMAEMYKR